MRSMLGMTVIAAMLCEAAGADAAAGGQTGGTPAKKGPEIEKVTMEDARVVEFVGKRKLLKESLFPEGSNPAVRLDFRNGRTITFVIPDTLLAKAAAHGMEQKLGDETAGEDDVDDMVLSVEELADRLVKQGLEGWTTRREGGMSGTSVLMKALIEYSGGKKTVEEVKAFLKDKSTAEKAGLRTSTQLKPIIDRIELEKAAKLAKVDTVALLAGFAA